MNVVDGKLETHAVGRYLGRQVGRVVQVDVRVQVVSILSRRRKIDILHHGSTTFKFFSSAGTSRHPSSVK